MEILVTPVGYAHNERKEPVDDRWSSIITTIELTPEIPDEALDGIESFSHLEIIYFFHLQGKTSIVTGAEHPRENHRWPKVGIFAQRKKARPNRIGSTVVRLRKREGRVLTVDRFDGIDMTPILDIKPVFTEYLPQGELRQPAWVAELMQGYW